MKNNRRIMNFKNLFILLTMLLIPFKVQAADDTTYYVSNLGGNGIQGFYAYSQYYYSTDIKGSEYKTYIDCNKESGEFDTSDCLYSYNEYYATCTVPSSYSRCSLVSGYKEYTYKPSSYPSSTYCAKNSGRVKLNCGTSRGDNIQWVYRTETKAKGIRACTNSIFTSKAVSYNGVNYGSGTYSGCYVTGSRICSCTTVVGQEQHSAYKYANLTTAHASIKTADGETVSA